MADKKINSKDSSPLRKGPAHAASGKKTGSPAAKKKASDKKYIAVLGISLTILLCTFFVAMGFGFSSYGGHIPSSSPAPSEEPEITSDSLVPVDKATGKINILILGVDVEGLRTDTMIVASYDLDNDKLKMLSIPRDTRMYIGKKYQKINAAHAITQSGNIKGPQGAIEAVTRLTGIPINYYVEFSFSAFRNTIDSLGGVYFDVPRDMNYEDPVQDLYIHLKKGYQLLDGDKSEQLVRFRRYAMGDLERVEMQQKFISALLEQKLQPETLKRLPDLFEQWKNDINTNLSLTDMIKLIPNISDLKTENITMFSAPGNYNDTDYGASYWIVNMKELAEIIETEFGYDASKITIHSADGSSVSKDSKTSSAKSPKPASGTPAASPAHTADSSETAAVTAKPTKTPGAAYNPKESFSAATLAPHTAISDKPNKTPEPRPSAKPTLSASQPAHTPVHTAEAPAVNKNTSDEPAHTAAASSPKNNSSEDKKSAENNTDSTNSAETQVNTNKINKTNETNETNKTSETQKVIIDLNKENH